MCVIATPTERLPGNFQRLIQVLVSSKCIYDNFDIGDLRSGQFCDLLSQWEKIERRLFWTKRILNTLKHRVVGRLVSLNWKIVISDSSSLPQGHFRSWKVTSSFSAITFDKDKLKQCKYLSCVQDDDTDRLICHMTFSDKAMTLTLTLTYAKFST